MTDRIICHPSLAQCINNLIINIGLSSMHWHTSFIGMKQVCHTFGTTVSKAWKSKCKKMDIKTIGINNESPLFYVILALLCCNPRIDFRFWYYCSVLINKLRSLTVQLNILKKIQAVCLTRNARRKSKGQTYRQPSMRCSHKDSSSRCFRRVGDKRISLLKM